VKEPIVGSALPKARRTGSTPGGALRRYRRMAMEQPTEFDLVVNLKVAKELGIKIPQSILMKATRVNR
jgi:hypothetical protein